VRRQVAERAGECCEYCLYPQELAATAHQIDHVIAEKHGGETTPENLALSCTLCNRRKGSDIASIDPVTGDVTATQAVETAQHLVDLSNRDRDKISGLGRAAASTARVHRALMERPIATSHWLVEKTGITAATVNKALGHLERLRIVRELTAQKRNRIFSYAGYVEIMNRGTEPPGRQVSPIPP
jgi:hypothetical protein